MNKKANYLITGRMVRDMCAESPRERLLHRVHCVALVYFGLSASEVARAFGDSPRAVSYWVTRFKKDGLNGLHDEDNRGRPSKLNSDQKKKLLSFIQQSRAKAQTVKPEMLSKYITNEFGVVLTTRQCFRILKRLTA